MNKLKLQSLLTAIYLILFVVVVSVSPFVDRLNINAVSYLKIALPLMGVLGVLLYVYIKYVAKLDQANNKGEEGKKHN